MQEKPADERDKAMAELEAALQNRRDSMAAGARLSAAVAMARLAEAREALSAMEGAIPRLSVLFPPSRIRHRDPAGVARELRTELAKEWKKLYDVVHNWERLMPEFFDELGDFDTGEALGEILLPDEQDSIRKRFGDEVSRSVRRWII